MKMSKDSEISCLGLLDKYAGLAAIESIRVGKHLSVDILYDGSLGFLVCCRDPLICDMLEV